MAMTIHVDIVSAETEIFSGPAEMVFAPAVEGEVGIAPRHAPLLTRLKPGEVRIQTPEGEELSFYVSGGMLEVQPHVVTVLSDLAERAEDLDEAAALEAKRRAEEAMKDRSAEMDYAKAQAELAEAAAQLRAIERLRKRSGRSH
ncbi:MAG: F0F1 ATP synthase subunit epsilon [Gammaproteobacteria bacterium]|nr:MAG: F0F1 ATP synthase subunit epsilon [Gammaproteobacteria bacterium]